MTAGGRHPRRAVVGLGSNLGDRDGALRGAVDALAATPGVEVVDRSPTYETAPVGGPPGQGPFLNGAVLLRTRLGPRPLLDRLLAIERGLGRRRRERWGPRVIDLDLLWMEGVAVDEPGLTVPHPRLLERAFALGPLLDVLPDAPAAWAERLEGLAGEPGAGGALGPTFPDARGCSDGFTNRRTSSMVQPALGRSRSSGNGAGKGTRTMADDTRREPRAPFATRVRYRSPVSDEFIEHESVDLSAGGVFVGTREPLDEGTLLKLELALAEDATIDAVGRVVWVRSPMTLSTAEDPPGMGVKFVKLSPDARSRLEDAITRRMDEAGRYEEGASPEDLVPSDPPAVGLAGAGAAGEPDEDPAPADEDGGAERAHAHGENDSRPAFGGSRASSAPPPPRSEREAGAGPGDAGPSPEPAEAAAARQAEDAAPSSAATAPPDDASAEAIEAPARPADPAEGSAGAVGSRAEPVPEPFPRPEEPSAPGWLLPVVLILAGTVALGMAFWMSFTG